MSAPPLLVVTGPTGVGKSALGIELAVALGAEVISVDAFAVYRGLDIGTDKPDAAARRRVRHHLVDVADPRECYSAGRFVRDAARAVECITARGKRPLLVGGTMFYVRALRRGLFPEPPKDAALRAQLEADWGRDPAALWARLESLDPQAARRISPSDKQRTLRALEVCLVAGRPISQLWAAARGEQRERAAVVLALTREREELRARIRLRVDRMFSAGLVEEVRRLLAGGVPPAAHALKGIGYRQALGVVQGAWSVAEAREATVVATCGLAKRQMTWLRSEPGVTWLPASSPTLLDDALRRLEACGE